MDHKSKPKKSEIIVVDQSALTKSAAWAWHEHGSGLNARSVREVDVRSSETEPRPSRYKLELLRNLQLDHTRTNSLFDNYEIQRISKQLDHYIESSHAKYHGGAPPTAAARKKKMSTIMPRGFWSRHVPVCSSSRGDVVENRAGFERRPDKVCVPVVGVVSCRPRPGPGPIRA